MQMVKDNHRHGESDEQQNQKKKEPMCMDDKNEKVFSIQQLC